MAIHPVSPDLQLIDLDLPREGFRRFISSWVLRRSGATLVVDPGPRATIPILLRALEGLGAQRVDGVLLTHIHIDHAGGAGLLADRYPESRILCHPKGIPHLLDPSKLWEGSRQVLGSLAEAYGQIAPVPSSRIGYQETATFGSLTVQAVETPGHAAHHLVFRVDDTLFAGELAGVSFPVAERTYQRPATPPTYFHEVFQESIDTALGLDARRLCFGHYGETLDAAGALTRARNQLDLWTETVARQREADLESLEDTVLQELLARDPLFAPYRELPPDVQRRERYFFSNTIKGMRGYVERR
jgi:glyoxylase-like metal-dependent hydrolase (beta-lactamase superfamily II)